MASSCGDVPGEADASGVLAGQQCGSARRADRAVGIRLREAHGLSCQRVDPRCLVELGPLAAKVAPAKVVDQHQHHVGPCGGGWWASGTGCRCRRQREAEDRCDRWPVLGGSSAGAQHVGRPPARFACQARPSPLHGWCRFRYHRAIGAHAPMCLGRVGRAHGSAGATPYSHEQGIASLTGRDLCVDAGSRYL